MNLYLVRHGEAEDPSVNPLRPISTSGTIQAEKIAAFLAANHAKPQGIWHSDKLRAIETARIIASAIQAEDRLKLHPGLSPMDSASQIQEDILAFSGDLMIVGHLPFMGNLLSLLLTGREDSTLALFDTACAACLQLGYGKASLLYFVGPSQLQ